MEKNFYTDDFEQLLREKTDEFRMYPSKRVWHSIYNDLHPSRKWPSIAVSMLMLLALLFLGYLNTNDNASTTIVAASKQNSNNNNQVKNSNQTNSTATDNNNGTTVQNEDATQINNLPATANSINNNSTAVNNSGTLSGKNKENSSLNNKPVIQLGNRHELATNKKGSDRQLYASTVTNKAKHRQHKNGNSEVVTGDNIFTTISIGNVNSVSENNTSANNNTSITQNTNTEGSEINVDVNGNNNLKTNISDANIASLTLNSNTPSANNKLKANDDKAWIEDYALYNKPGKNKWKDRMAMELYATPSIGYRTLGTDMNPVMPTAAFGQALSTGDKKISQHPALGLEAGIGLAYSFAKNLRLKAGVQVNYTSYGVDADLTNHPILTNLLMNDLNNGHTFLSSRTSTLSNSYGLNPVTVHNTTFQFSIPIGFAFRIAGNNKMEWYAGASVQPSFIMGGATHFISSDYNNYVSDQTLLRRWNMNTGIETYLNYKLGGFALQVGPQLRYQLFSTYNKKSTVTEKLYNMGLKVGVVKSF